MSVLFENENGWLLCHLSYLKSVYGSDLNEDALKNINRLFDIFVPYVEKNKGKSKKKKRKREAQDSNDFDFKPTSQQEIDYVHRTYKILVEELRSSKMLQNCSELNTNKNNNEAQEIASTIYRLYINPNCNFNGRNDSSTNIITNCHGNICIFPPKCRFFNCDIRKVDLQLTDEANKYNVILMDPPWWNKYIRRKKRKCNAESYEMLYNQELLTFPMNHYLNEEGLVLIWCTNAPSHIHELLEKLLPSWNLEHVATWYWLKVTTSGEVVCPFSEPCQKQPFERIIIASRSQNLKLKFAALDKKLILSVPSAIHSHKPPVADILNRLLPENSKCLELFARYLLPEWTSIGNEVLKLQCYPGLDLIIKKSQQFPLTDNLHDNSSEQGLPP